MERVPGNLAATRAPPPPKGYCGLTVNTMTEGRRLFAPMLLDRSDPRLTVRIHSPALRLRWKGGQGDEDESGAKVAEGGPKSRSLSRWRARIALPRV
eukprot:9357920-Pyramimonas_sp.AAC.1